MRYLLALPGLLLMLWATPVDSVGEEDRPPVQVRFHCRKDGCCDHHEWCRFWASVNQCKSNAEWMRDNCQIACGTCRTSPNRQPFSRNRRPPSRRPTARRPPLRRPVPQPAPLVTQRPTFPTVARTFQPFATRPPPPPPAPVPVFTPAPRPQAQPFVNNNRRPTGHFKRFRHRLGLSHRLRPNTDVSTIATPQTFSNIPSTIAVTVPTVAPIFTVPNTVAPFTTTTTVPPTTTVFTTVPTTTVPTTTTTVPTTTTTTTVPTTTTTVPTTTTTVPTTTTTVTTTTPTTTTTTSTITTTTATTVPTTTTTVPQFTTFTQSNFELDGSLRGDEERFRTRFPPQRATTRNFFFNNNRQQFFTQRAPPPPPPPTTTTTTTTTTTPFTTTTTTRPPPPRNFGDARCRDIIRDPVVSAEEMIRERLVVATENNSRRQTVDLDMVIRSNTANACVPRMDEAACEANMCYNAYFRTMDGTCNNLQNPLRGASYRPYTRLLPTIYDNELSEPVGSLFPNLRPSPREITRTLTSSHASVTVDEYNALVMQFGQFISHDMAKTTLVPSAKCNVCQNITSRCMSVPVTNDDTNMGFKRNTCIRVSRSSPICGSGSTKPRQQLNENTGYIDASPIYGSSVHDSEKFRNGNTGFLKLPMFNGMQMLPFDQGKCRNPRQCTVIFTAGDSRVNLFVGLSAWHTLFTREHNRIASTLQRLNPHWNGERLFQESRKIVGAEVQAIVYREWLPKVLGAAFAAVVGDYHGYDPNIDSTVANEFTSAAFRFGHGMIQEFYQRVDSNFNNITFGALAFQKGTLHSDVLVNEGGPDPLIRGMFTQNVKRPQRVTTTVTENMFGSTDLSSINIQRGRDHGHPAYVKYRELCGMGVATTFDHLSREILNTGTREKLRKVYGSVERIDLWVGALLEDPVIRGLVGPTVACIVGPQFKRTRDGDRFYYENPGVFTRRQLAEIRKSSLSRIICDNSNSITMVPREAFRIGHLTPCNQIPQMDLNQWRE